MPSIFRVKPSLLIQILRDVRVTYFTRTHPASGLGQVSRLVRPELLIEIEAVAVAGRGK